MVDPPEADKLDSIRKILEASDVATSVTDKPADLYSKLRGVLRKAQGDDNINAAVAAFKKAGVWKE